MDSQITTTRSVAVIGGGISGLAAAHRIRELDPDCNVVLYEGGDVIGGILQTESIDGYLIERSADMFTTRDTAAIDLCCRLGFDEHLIGTNSQHRRPLIIRNGELHPMPAGWSMMVPGSIRSVLTSPLLNWRGRLRVLMERCIRPRRDTNDESLAEFARRRFGKQGYERIIQPLIGGIYTADPERLSMKATLETYRELVREHGSLWRSRTRRQPSEKPVDNSSGARYGMFLTPSDGMQSLVKCIADALPNDAIQLNAHVRSISPIEGNRWKVQGDAIDDEHDGVIVALGASDAAVLLNDADQDLSDLLSTIPQAGAAILAIGLDRQQISHPLDAFGIIVPQIEDRPLIAISLSSVKFEGRAPDGKVLMRVFVGGASQPHVLGWDDETIKRRAWEQVVELLGVDGQPELLKLYRWDGKMPQYHIGHVELVDQIEDRVNDLTGLEVAGNAYRGVGIPACIESGEAAAQRMVNDLTSR